MTPPKCKAMEDYKTLSLKIGELDGALFAAKQELQSIPRRMARELRTERERLDAARYLYWFTDVPAKEVATGLLGMDLSGWHVDRFLQRIGTMTCEVTCDRCHQLMQFRSRQEMKEILRDLRRGRKRYAEGYSVLCASCWEAVQRERGIPYQRGRNDDA